MSNAVEPRRSRWLVFAAGLAAALLVVLAGVGWTVFDRHLREDPGVTACETVRDGEIIGGSVSDADYRRVRGGFEESDHAALRDHGTKLMDAVWNLARVPQGQEVRGIGFLGPLTTHAQGLQSACADHGVFLDLNG